jgi:flagellar biosynthesis/type III secretory pathway chaperone
MQAATREPNIDGIFGLLDRLELALKDENAALRARDTDSLLKAVEDKRRALQDLAAAWAQFGPESAPDASGRHSVPTRLIERLAEIRMLNETSGGAIAALLHNTRAALGLLGMPTDSPAYGASGLGAGTQSPRALAIG